MRSGYIFFVAGGVFATAATYYHGPRESIGDTQFSKGPLFESERTR